MKHPVKLIELEVNDFKRIKAVKINFTGSAMTIIGGNNSEGKTSSLDAICYALGGERYRPTDANRRDSNIPLSIKLTLSNGLVVERKGKNSVLKVTDPTGMTHGQSLLKTFIEELALNLPKFMESSDKEKVQALLNIIGVGDELAKLEMKEKTIYDRRRDVGSVKDSKVKHAEEMHYYPDAPEELVSVSDLIHQQQAILHRNAKNQELRQNASEAKSKFEQSQYRIGDLKNKIEALQQELLEAEVNRDKLHEDYKTAGKAAHQLEDESTEALEKSLSEIETTNTRVRANLEKERANEEGMEYTRKYDALTAELEAVRKEKVDLLEGADLPLPGLSVSEGELLYEGVRWDCMSGAERLIVATSIVRKLNPECGFVLMDKLEQMDLDTLASFSEWLESEGLQVIATRVSKGPECSLIIEDGFGENDEPHPAFKVTPRHPVNSPTMASNPHGLLDNSPVLANYSSEGGF